MSTEPYLKSLNERLKKLDAPKAQKLFNQWSYNYLVHAKAIHQYSPEIHILLLKYSIHLIYNLAKTHPELSNKINKFFSDNNLELAKIEKMSNNFNPDKYCIFEDFTNFIAKSFEAVENDYKEKILNIKEFSDYAQIIAVYKLLADLLDMVEIWREKDEDLQKFQNLCKFRAIQIMRAKKDYENSPEGKEYENEVNKLNEQIRQEKLLEEQRKKEMMNNQAQNRKTFLARTATHVQGASNYGKKNNLLNVVNSANVSRSPGKMGSKINNDPLNPFSGGFSNPYNLPKPSINIGEINKKLPRKKFNYSKNDKEAQEIHQMYMNYDPGEYEKVSDPNSNQNNNINNYYNINPNPNIQINRNNIDETINMLLKGYEYPGSNEVQINSVPVLFKSEDYYKLRLHIKSVLIPKIIGQLNKNDAEEAYKNSKMLLYYLSLMNSK